MRRSFIISLCSVLCLLYSAAAFATDYNSTGSTTEQRVQTRVGADFTKHWKCGVQLSIGEELRFDLMDNVVGTTSKSEAIDTAYGAAFNKSYTTLSLAYTPIEYVKLDAGYTLRILGRKDWSAPNEFIRHRVFFGVTGSYKTQYAKLYLRERFLLEMRTDSVNTDEKQAYAWLLRSRLGADFYVPGKPVKPYIWAELENTLNAPEFQQNNGQQFITNVRLQAGVKWRITKLSSLNFYYRFTYGYDRDINVNKSYYSGKTLKLRLDEQKEFQHAIGVQYSLDW
ncbi:MAG: DUF2490 domain-containing protein [Paludibacteraceae bacterium]|nr:DUF2490 domain-containing protein [Paludibacteraceae bacterium]